MCASNPDVKLGWAVCPLALEFLARSLGVEDVFFKLPILLHPLTKTMLLITNKLQIILLLLLLLPLLLFTLTMICLFIIMTLPFVPVIAPLKGVIALKLNLLLLNTVFQLLE